MIEEGFGPQLDAFRAPVNNDNWGQSSWYEHGLNRMQQKSITWNKHINENGSVSIVFVTESQAEGCEFKFQDNVVYTVYADGSIEVQSAITSNKPTLVLPRLGYVMKLPKSPNNSLTMVVVL